MEDIQQLKTIASNLPGILFRAAVHGDAFHITFVAGEVEKLSGYRPQELLQATPIDFDRFLRPDEREKLKELVVTAATEQRRFQTELRLVRKNSKERWVFLKGQVFKEDEQLWIEGFILDIQEQKYAESINRTLFHISNAVNTTHNLSELYDSIYLALNQVIDASNFYIALYNAKRDSITFPYHVDQYDNFEGEVANISESTTLTGEVIKSGRPVVARKQDLLDRVKKSNKKSIGVPAEMWVGIPLKTKDTVIGAMVTQSYTDADHYSERDVEVLVAVSDQVALAIERKQAEGAIKQSEERYRSVMEAAPVPVVVYDIEGRVTYLNPAFAQTFGWKLEEVTGKHLNFVPEENLPETHKAVERMLRGETVRDLETRRTTKDGRILEIQGSSSTFTDQDGHPAGSIVILRDITEKKRMMAALQQSEERYRSVMEAAPDPVVVYDIEGRVTYLNPAFAQTFGWKLEEVTGKHLNFVPEENLPETHKAVERMLRGETVRDLETRRTTKDGRILEIQGSSSTFTDQDGHPAGSIVILRDITEKKRMEAELRRARDDAETANRTKSEFLANMSHEIRTPMNAILGMADLLSETILTQEQKKYVEIFQRSGEGLLHLINNILDLSKVEAGQLELEQTSFDVHDIVERICEIMALKAHEKGIELLCRIDQAVPSHLIGDPTRLRQILANLIGNAVKFTQAGEIEVKLSVDDTADMTRKKNRVNLAFQVRDTGIGIVQKNLDRIFDSFTQADSSTTRQYGGTGLGLTICRRLVHMMQGQLNVESKSGKGSRFSFTVPLAVAARPIDSKSRNDADLKGLRVLVVDDNATNRLILKSMMAAWAIKVTEVNSGDQALQCMKDAENSGAPFQFILLDGVMPKMDGFETAQQIKDQFGHLDHTVMMLSSDNRDGHISKARNLGIAAYMVKPVKRLELRQALNSALRQGRQQMTSPKATTRPPEVNWQRPLSILLVEDNRNNQMLFKFYLKGTPHTIAVAENGQQGLDAYKDGAFDVVFMDMNMPVMDGYQATRAIRLFEQKQNRPATPVIALTAYALKGQEAESFTAGCSAHITKPFKKAQLVEMLQTVNT